MHMSLALEALHQRLMEKNTVMVFMMCMLFIFSWIFQLSRGYFSSWVLRYTELRKMMTSRITLLNVQRRMLREYGDALVGMWNGSFEAESGGWAERGGKKSQKGPSVISMLLPKCIHSNTVQLVTCPPRLQKTEWVSSKTWLHPVAEGFVCCLSTGFFAKVSRDEVNLNVSLKSPRKVGWCLEKLMLNSGDGLTFKSQNTLLAPWGQWMLWGPAQLLEFPWSGLYKYQPKDTGGDG